MVRGKGFGFQKNFIASWSRLKERQLLGTKKEDKLKCTSADILPACNLIKTALLSCRLQRIPPRNHQCFSVYITFIIAGKHYNTVFHRVIMKVTRDLIVKTSFYKNQKQRPDCGQGSLDFTQPHHLPSKNSKQHKRTAFLSQL